MSSSFWAELGFTWREAGLTVVTAAGIYAANIAFSRVFSQRQFSTSTSYDLAFTFAMGSLVGRVILVRTSLATAVLGLLTMFVLHALTGWLHHYIRAVHRAIQNRPVPIVARGRMLDAQLRKAKTSDTEVYQQLRLQGLGTLDGVHALILERNGQLSLITSGTSVEERVGAASTPAGTSTAGS